MAGAPAGLGWMAGRALIRDHGRKLGFGYSYAEGDVQWCSAAPPTPRVALLSRRLPPCAVRPCGAASLRRCVLAAL
eukprot:1253535-Prymnesium_polylepis.2